MAWDLRGSLLKKEERESARLADFDFKLRARTFRLLADRLGARPAEIVPLIAQGGDSDVLGELARRFPAAAPGLNDFYAWARAEARTQLIAEDGDPSPHRLA